MLTQNRVKIVLIKLNRIYNTKITTDRVSSLVLKNLIAIHLHRSGKKVKTENKNIIS